MKLKKRLYKLKKLPFGLKLLCGIILALILFIKVILRILLLITESTFKLWDSINTKYIQPKFELIHDRIYKRACLVFEYETNSIIDYSSNRTTKKHERK